MESKIIEDGEEGVNSVLEFKPRKLEKFVTQEVTEFLSNQRESKNTFKMSDVVSEITGVKEVERSEIEKRIEEAALIKLETIQEEAYQKAYELGKEEGHAQSLKENQEKIDAQLKQVTEVVESIEQMKMDLLSQNEAQFIRLIYHIAKEIAMEEINKNDERIIGVLKECMKSAQSDENILIRISNEDLESFKNLKDSLPKEIEFLKDASFEGQEDIERGGCIIETNYGVIDASLEQRVKKVWETLDAKKPKSSGEKN